MNLTRRAIKPACRGRSCHHEPHGSCYLRPEDSYTDSPNKSIPFDTANVKIIADDLQQGLVLIKS
jgi:hypothetical protein